MIYRLLIICLIIAMIFGLYLNIKNYENTDYIINTKLQNITELESTKLGKYLCRVYGKNTFTNQDFPLSFFDFQIFYTDILEECDIDVPSYTKKCPSKLLKNGILYNMSGSHDPQNTLWITEPSSFIKNTEFPSNTKIEVTHCSDDKEVQDNEKKGSWMYYAKGSGIYFDLGNTIAFDNHNDAVNFFLKNDGDYCWNTECVKYFEKMISKAKDIGYDSIQFLSHSDMRCGYIAHEIIDVNGIGIYSCPSEDSSTKFYMGYKGRVSLRGCDATKPCLNTELSK